MDGEIFWFLTPSTISQKFYEAKEHDREYENLQLFIKPSENVPPMLPCLNEFLQTCLKLKVICACLMTVEQRKVGQHLLRHWWPVVHLHSPQCRSTPFPDYISGRGNKNALEQSANFRKVIPLRRESESRKSRISVILEWSQEDIPIAESSNCINRLDLLTSSRACSITTSTRSLSGSLPLAALSNNFSTEGMVWKLGWSNQSFMVFVASQQRWRIPGGTVPPECCGEELLRWLLPTMPGVYATGRVWVPQLPSGAGVEAHFPRRHGMLHYSGGLEELKRLSLHTNGHQWPTKMGIAMFSWRYQYAAGHTGREHRRG